MRKVTLGLATSVDNFIARADGGVDWLRWSDDVQAITREFWKTIDSVVMGRLTYDAAVAAGMTSYPGVKNYVCSSTLADSPDPAVEIVRGDAAAFLREMKAGEGKGIAIIGGGRLADALFAEGLIDEVSLNVHPVLLGEGIPLFAGIQRQIDLELAECRTLQHGCVFVTYRVKHG
ncbi:MAG TPA: dihydrofolate reductase family protein [Longimicrobium sp.]|nr:dihydrofolate reductase family protein [Longimicrobium sp.]